MKIEASEKGQTFILTETIEYTLEVINTRAILRKATKAIVIKPHDSGHAERQVILSPFDIYIQILEGRVEVIMDFKKVSLETGQRMIIPSYTNNVIATRAGAKVLTTVMPNGHEDDWFI